MADTANTTPGALSRRFFCTVAAALPFASATASPATPPDPVRGLAALLLEYREVGMQLRAVSEATAAALAKMPAWARPGVAPGQPRCRWPEWSRDELDAFGLPSTMPQRPSLADLQRFNFERFMASPADEEVLNLEHRARIDAWAAKRLRQNPWFRRTGADALRRRRQELLNPRHGIEGELMDLLTTPGVMSRLRQDGFDA
jgi:hypothetical protein